MAVNNNEAKTLRALLKEDFKSLVHKVFLELNPTTAFKDGWHIEVLCHELMCMVEGTEKRLIINLPPRHLKSIIGSIALPAFILGQDPSASIICVSYAEDFAISLALNCKKIIESDWYREIFPGTRLNPAKKAVNDFMTTRGGGRFATSVGGILTGRGADYIIIDDPIKADDANSNTIRERINEWFRNTLYSRLNDKKEGKILLIMQRTHQMDLTGYLLEGEGFKLIKMPALAMDKETWVVENRITNSIKIFKRNVGEALHPAREDENTLKGIKENIGSLNFAGQYQQDPMAEDGGIIKKEYIKYYDYKSLPKFKSYDLYYGYYSSYVAHINKIVVSWDVAFRAKENSDYSVGITFLQDTKGTIYIIDLIREKLEMPALLRRITQYNEQLKEKFSGHRALNIVEAVGGGLGLAQILKKECGVQAKEAIPTTDKATRLKNIAYLIETGHCLFPNDNPPWLDGFLRELFIFPNGKHDDQCDALSQGLAYLRKGPSHIGVSSQW